MNADALRTTIFGDRARHATRAGAAFLSLALLASLATACVTVSAREEVEMGRQYSEQLNEELPLIQDAAIRGPVSDLGLRLARVSPRPDLPYEFQVVNTDVINAFAVPGGFIYMNRGLIAQSENMSEVAGVLAHEVSHVVARHSAEQLERARRAGLGLALGSIILGRPEGLAAVGVNVAANLYFAKHSREAEAEADSLAVGIMVEAGWDPCGLVAFFGTLLRERGDKPGALEALFASHPVTEDRIEAVDRIVGRLPAEVRSGLRRDSPAYGRLKAALEAYAPPPEKYRVQEEEREEDGGGAEPVQLETRACAAP